MKRIFVKCVRCNGHGKTPLSKPLAATLAAIKECDPCTATEIYERLKTPKLDRSAVNQRVKKLEKLKHVKSEKPPRRLRLYWAI